MYVLHMENRIFVAEERNKGQTKVTLAEVCDPLPTRSLKPRFVVMSAFHMGVFQQDVIIVYLLSDKTEHGNEINYWIQQVGL